MSDLTPDGDPLPTDTQVAPELGPLVSEVAGTGVLSQTYRGVWVSVSGTLVFKDGAGTSHTLAATYFTAGLQYGFQITEITSGTLVGKLLK